MGNSGLNDALKAAERLPSDFGHAVRATRLLLTLGEDKQAGAVARSFVAQYGLPESAASDFLLLLRRARTQELAVGDTLIEEGHEGDALYVIYRGKAQVARMGVGDLDTMEPGAVVGEIAPLTGVARTASVKARTPLEVVVFDADAQDLLHEDLEPVYAQLQATGRTRLARQMMGPDALAAELTDDERAALYARCLPCTLPDGTRIIREGHVSNAVCIIASGHADVWRRGDGGTRATLATLGPGEVFGELALLYGKIATATVEAVTPLTVFALDQAGFAEALRQFPGAQERVHALAKARLAEHKIRDLGTPLPVVRVVRP